jgi:hypothetical protein
LITHHNSDQSLPEAVLTQVKLRQFFCYSAQGYIPEIITFFNAEGHFKEFAFVIVDMQKYIEVVPLASDSTPSCMYEKKPIVSKVPLD